MAGHAVGPFDGVLACTTPLTNTIPGWVMVIVNGLEVRVGNGTKVGVDCYFSGDLGVTARASGALTSDDFLYWNFSVAGYQIADTDTIDFIYSV